MRLIWGQTVGRRDCPYLRRWVLDLGLFSIRLHHWLAGDDPRAFHDHPWWFVTAVLWGWYADFSQQGTDVLRAGSVRCRPAAWKHTVRVGPRGAWTLLLTGPERRQWGFWVNGRFRPRNKYFFEYGQHPCEGVR